MIALQASANVATPSRNIHMRMLSSSIITLTQYQLLRHLSLLQSNTYHYLPSYSTFSVLDDQDDDDAPPLASRQLLGDLARRGLRGGGGLILARHGVGAPGELVPGGTALLLLEDEEGGATLLGSTIGSGIWKPNR